jgi:formylglycine-generating enzyme required for sulfatase activity
MGSNENDNEKPPHKVNIARPFALGRYAVTFEEWDACVAAGGCNGYKPKDQGWERRRRPVINVSWDDAQAYAKWLSGRTGQTYRLPSEAEREHAARARTDTRYFWGDDIGRGNANCIGCGSQWDGKQTAPVGSFKPNPFGLYDMHGNVWEWAQDCYVDNYKAAPTDGRAVETSGCVSRVLRGGSWYYNPRGLRSAFRYVDRPVNRYLSFGFRLARTLPPTP